VFERGATKFSTHKRSMLRNTLQWVDSAILDTIMNVRFQQIRGIPRLPEGLLAAEERLFSMELVQEIYRPKKWVL